LKADFEKHAGPDGLLEAHELANVWKEAATKKVGKLSAEDESLIDSSSKSFFVKMDADRGGKVTYEEFVTYMLGQGEVSGAIKGMRDKLNEHLAKDPAKIQALIKQFHAWDKNGDGYVTPDELDAHLKEIITLSSSDGNVTPSEANLIEEARKIKSEIFEAADADSDGRVDLWEVMAHATGRRKTPVEILLYDISGGFASKYGALLLGQRIEAVHSGVLVFGSEYWYGGKVFRSDPPCSKAFGQPLRKPWNIELPTSEYRPDLQVVRVGYTFVTHQEFAVWLTENVISRYTGIQQYDLLTHSCNHFSNECVTFLTGAGLPDKIFDLQKKALTPTVRMLRPYINKYLGGFADGGKSIDEQYFTKDNEPEVTGATSVGLCQDVLGKGDVVLVDGIKGIDSSVVATLLEEKEGKCTVKYFDPETGAVKQMNDVAKGRIRPVPQG
jgi:Ca2+-binding EF-hand superfamily protein